MTKPGPQQSRVLIVGGGIGGLTDGYCACAERHERHASRALGVRRRDRRRHPAWAQCDACPGRASACSTRSRRSPSGLTCFGCSMESTGDTLASVPLGSVAEQRYGAPYLTFHRADLHAALLSTCQRARGDRPQRRLRGDGGREHCRWRRRNRRGRYRKSKDQASSPPTVSGRACATTSNRTRACDSPALPPGVRFCRATKSPRPSMLRASGSGSDRARISCITRCAAERM